MDEHDVEQRAAEPGRRRRSAAQKPDVPRLYETASGAARLQQRLGNAGVMQLRRILQRAPRTFGNEDAPEWIKQELNLDRSGHDWTRDVESGLDAADATLSPTAGTPLDSETRVHAEQSLGVSMEGVNVVQRADSATGPLEAHAFAASDGAGRHSIALSSDVDLGTPDGEFTLMHELAHVAQQKTGQADSLDGLGGDEGARQRLEDDADQRARRLLRGG
jgi:hypothetical protein